ncbi:MAG TPA: ATP-binding protein [Bacteroidales bacterium]|jgi:hypothetical protein|nr:ATP-binding protein [Bacteroidales bacterium]
MYYNRIAESLIKEYLKSFRVVGIMGPRQSGKSTMIRHLLKDSYNYITFDSLEIRELFNSDPVLFIQKYNRHIVFDEVQQVPDLFPLIKTVVDKNPGDKGRFVLTGSGQFLLSKNISESLAGRIGVIPLLPMQYSESPDSYRRNFILSGGYPEIAAGNIRNPLIYFDSYLNTYLQKDLRAMINVSDLHAFTQLIRLLAVRVTQILNLSGLSKEIGVTVSTISRWISVLEASYIIFLLNPHHNNLGKRIVKSPKIYFYDNGLLDYLTGTVTHEQIETGILSGPLFENLIISEIRKSLFHYGNFSTMSFLRTNHGDEIDLILDSGTASKLLEIKSSVTYRPHFHKALVKMPDDIVKARFVIYKGETREVIQNITAWNYHDFLNSDILQNL